MGKNIVKRSAVIFMSAIIFQSGSISRATIDTAQESELKYKAASQEMEELYIQRLPSVKKLVPEVTLGLTHGFDTNPNLDSSKKSDSYVQESLDARYRYPIEEDLLDVRFGFDVVDITYYNVTDASLFDGIAYANLEHRLLDNFVLTGGYLFNAIWYPNDENGTYFSNEVSGTFRHRITDDVYEKAAYRFSFKNYTSRKRRLGNAKFDSESRFDSRHTFEHEVGVYIFDSTNIKVLNQFLLNDSNDQYFDYYDYNQYKFGPSITQRLTKKFYNVTSFSLIHREYEDRLTTDKGRTQKDNLYIASTSFMFDITKAASIYATYSYRENLTTEPLDKYSGSIVATGLYFSF